jgi:heterodisulfide reductase subunit A
MPEDRVLVIGAGIAGLTASRTLALLGARVDLVERRAVAGGHAAQFSCKATDRCVKCGACLVTEAVAAVMSDPRITLHTASRVQGLRRTARRFEFAIEPVEEQPHAHGRTAATGHGPAPPVAARADAVVLCAGFGVFDPRDKAYGHGLFPNVLTNLELERRLRGQGRLTRPSDGAAPRRVAFIQCVGSRDAQRGHLWCSQFCCAAALRAGLRIKALAPETELTVFYIDIQSFGRDFERFYAQSRQALRFVRAVPVEAFEVENAGIRLCYTEGALKPAVEEVFDLVVLSTGMVPADGLTAATEGLGLAPAADGFAASAADIGIFAAGAVRGPMGIADSLADARHAAAGVWDFLDRRRGRAAAPTAAADPAPRDPATPPGA